MKPPILISLLLISSWSFADDFQDSLEILHADSILQASVQMPLDSQISTLDSMSTSLERAVAERDSDPLRYMLASVYGQLGVYAERYGMYDLALTNLFKGLKLCEALGDDGAKAVILNNIGLVYFGIGNWEEARSYTARSEEIFAREGQFCALGNLFWNLANVNRQFPTIRDSMMAISSDYYYKCGGGYGLGGYYFTLGMLPHSLDSIKILFDSALVHYKSSGAKSLIQQTHSKLAESYIDLGMLDLALAHSDTSLEIAQELNYGVSLSTIYKIRFKTFKARKEWQKSLEMFERYTKLSDSLQSEENQKDAIRQQTKYEFEKAQLVEEQKEKEVLRLEAEQTSRRDNLQYSIILLGLLVLGALVLGLGKLAVSERIAEGLIFFSFLILFEFILVLADPYVETWTGGAPGLKLLINAGIAALIFPLHSFFEIKMKNRIVT